MRWAVLAAAVAMATVAVTAAELDLGLRDFTPSSDCSYSSSCSTSASTSAASSWDCPMFVLAFAAGGRPSTTTSFDSSAIVDPSAASAFPLVVACPLVASLALKVAVRIPPLCF